MRSIERPWCRGSSWPEGCPLLPLRQTTARAAAPWAAAALREGVGVACSSGSLSRYRGVLDDGAEEEKLVLGLATIRAGKG